MKAAKVMKAKFASRCVDYANEGRELCDGIETGDAIVFSKGWDTWTDYPRRRIYKAAGHVECRKQDWETQHVAPLVKIMKGQPNPASDEIIDGIAQELRDSWLQI